MLGYFEGLLKHAFWLWILVKCIWSAYFLLYLILTMDSLIMQQSMYQIPALPGSGVLGVSGIPLLIN